MRNAKILGLILVTVLLAGLGCCKGNRAAAGGSVEGIYKDVQSALDTVSVFEKRTAITKKFEIEPARQDIPDLDDWTLRPSCGYGYRTQPLDPKTANAPENALRPKIHGFLDVSYTCADAGAKGLADLKAAAWASSMVGWSDADAARADGMRTSAALATRASAGMAAAGLFGLDFNPLKCAAQRASIAGESQLFDLQLACRKFGQAYKPDWIAAQRAPIAKALTEATKELNRKRSASGVTDESVQRCGAPLAEKVEAIPATVEFQAGAPVTVYGLGVLKGETLQVSVEPIDGTGPGAMLAVYQNGCEDQVQRGWGRVQFRVGEDGVFPLAVTLPASTNPSLRYKVTIETDGRGLMPADRRKEVAEFAAWAQKILSDDVAMSDFLRFRDGADLACARAALLDDKASIRNLLFGNALDECLGVLDGLVQKRLAAKEIED